MSGPNPLLKDIHCPPGGSNEEALFSWDCLNGGDNASQLPGAYLTTRDGNALPPAAVVSRRNLKIPSLHSLPSKLILISSVSQSCPSLEVWRSVRKSDGREAEISFYLKGSLLTHLMKDDGEMRGMSESFLRGRTDVHTRDSDLGAEH